MTESDPLYVPTLNRRETLEWLAAMSVVSALPRLGLAAAGAVPGVVSRGYGTDPNLNEPVVPWPLIMEPGQLKQTAVLADLILPGSPTSPAPSALGVADFVNEWVSAPYPDQVKDRSVIFDGLRWVDSECVRRGQRSFLESDPGVREAVVNDIAAKQPQGLFATRGLFFRRFRFLVVSSYYTTAEGFKDIGYTGNVPLAEYPPVTDEERAILDGALSKLGIGASR